jgi:tetratricopeptide (TPR) repeat protein
VKAGLPLFLRALSLANEFDIASGERQRRIAEAYKELGFYNRNLGLWDDADKAYEQARAAISEALSIRGTDEDREELASIQTNWAYVKGQGGLYRAGANLVESAITVRHRLGKHQEEGISYSVRGEIYRYERRFQMAWQSYSIAEEIFEAQRNWYWLGLIYQEQAICLFQARQDEISLAPDGDQLAEAKRLIIRSLGICRDAAVRGYPSALNRAGRIFGEEDPDAGLGYLAEGVEQARRLADGWFLFASLVEYVELSYRAWVKTGRDSYRNQIPAKADDIRQAMSEYHFPDLRGRWYVLLGHLAIHDWDASRDSSYLATALTNYKEGFEAIAQGGYVGSSGTAMIPATFETFGNLFGRLPPDVRAEWYEELRHAWMNQEEASTLLLPGLEELY